MLEVILSRREHAQEGWQPSLEKESLAMDKIDATLKVVGAKQKFGCLRVRPDRCESGAYALMHKTTSRSLQTCVQCGAAAASRIDSGYYVTSCAQHATRCDLAVGSRKFDQQGQMVMGAAALRAEYSDVAREFAIEVYR
ncbi:hypothetical protein [Sphingomonas xinjiangensis]|uniref:Uncharacterized protein n=1 Tax=Sphingomonas xinjiangensis TaxID=643568 RepID=A0A840YSP6_9SPHN|nr:hypothetical protein [Sphingomonas xinjiangensis]MBB5712698.1 hypothetical protein [Sphingomonas xinjiangensis]